MKKALAHIIPWLVFTAYLIYSNKDHYAQFSTEFYLFKQTIATLQIAIIFYLNYFVSVPTLLIRRRKPFLFSFAVVGLLIIDMLLGTALGLLLDSVLGYTYFYEFSITSFLQGFFIPSLFIGLSTGIRLAQQYYRDRYHKLELQERVKQAELDTLKAQINPHFLYNAFNSIYALAQAKSDKTADAVLQLSTVMRYITYQASNAQVSIQEELNFIKNYIEFQKLRTNEPEKKIVTSIEDPKVDFHISPLLLITFVENAFKHSNLVRSTHPIQVSFKAHSNGFNYSVSNEIAQNKDRDSGVGLDNLKKILALTYPGQYELKIWEENGIHHAELNLNLSK